MGTIILTTEKLLKKEGTKTVFLTESKDQKTIDLDFYRNMTSESTISFFRRIGGTETITREYTSRGYTITKIVSTSPNKENKTIRTFNFL